MSDKIPQTKEEIVTAIKNECYKYMLSGEAEHLAKLIVRWREAWLRDAEPRLRPVTEAPQAGDAVVIAHKTGDWRSRFSAWIWCEHSATSISQHNDVGWYLIKRAAVPLTHEQALELLVRDIRSLGNTPEQLLVALAKAEEALAEKKP